MKSSLIFIAILLIHYVSFLSGQSINLNGKVVDLQSNPVSNVKVTLEGRGIVAYSDNEGYFSITNVGIDNRNAESLVSYDGIAVYLTSSGERTVISLYEIEGKLIQQIVHSNLQTGRYKFYPSAYLPDGSIEMYIVTVNSGSQLYSFKILNTDSRQLSRGLISLDNNGRPSGLLNSSLKAVGDQMVYRNVDKLIFEHESFQRKEVSITSYIQNLGNVTMDEIINAPTAPSGLSAEAQDQSTINLSWTDNSDNESGFKVEVSPNGSGNWTEIASLGANETSYQVTGLTASTTYYYQVRAYNEGGNSAYSNTANATTQAAANVPVLSGPSQATESFTLSWTFNWPMLVSSDDHYELEWSHNQSSGYQVLAAYPNGVRTTPYSDIITPDAVDIGKTSYFRVRVKSSGSYTGYSNVVAVNVPYLNLSFFATLDNSMLKASNIPEYEDRVYNNSDLAVGANYVYNLYVNDYLIYASALYFNIERYIAGRTIHKAILKLKVKTLPADWNTNYIINALAGAWNTNTITFNNTPNFYLSPSTVISPPVTGTIPWEIDITAIVQAWASGTFHNNGILMRDNNIAWPGYTALRATIFESLESAFSDNEKPQLYVEIQ